MKSLRAFSLLIVLLSTSFSASAGGLGWYYESFSWNALQSYFGGGTPAQKLAYLQHLEALVQLEREDPFYGIEFSPQRVAHWRSLINEGIAYERLGRPETIFTDTVLFIVMGREAELRELDVQSHTSPDYIHSGAFRHLLVGASTKAREFLGLFRYGRSYLQTQGRSACADVGEAWSCRGAYVVLSPEECSNFGQELLAALNSATFRESEYEEQKFVKPLASALVEAGRQGRGMYLHATD